MLRLLAKIYGKNKPFMHEIVKKENEIFSHFSVALQTAKFMAKVNDKCLVNMGKSLNYSVQNCVLCQAPIEAIRTYSL